MKNNTVTNEMLKEELLVCIENKQLTNKFADYANRICLWWLNGKSKWRADEEMKTEIRSAFLYKLNYNWVKIKVDENISAYLIGAIRFRESEQYRALKLRLKKKHRLEDVAEIADIRDLTTEHHTSITDFDGQKIELR